jgi:hypothetical protein
MAFRPTDDWTPEQKAVAKAILFEPSPYEADGGELIGRDPRKISAADYATATLDGAPLLKVIRAKCLDRAVEQESEVRKCVLVTCPNWPFRSRDLTDEQRAAASERGRALHRARTNSGLINNQVGTSSASSGHPNEGMTTEDDFQ